MTFLDELLADMPPALPEGKPHEHDFGQLALAREARARAFWERMRALVREEVRDALAQPRSM